MECQPRETLLKSLEKHLGREAKFVNMVEFNQNGVEFTRVKCSCISWVGRSFDFLADGDLITVFMNPAIYISVRSAHTDEEKQEIALLRSEPVWDIICKEVPGMVQRRHLMKRWIEEVRTEDGAVTVGDGDTLQDLGALEDGGRLIATVRDRSYTVEEICSDTAELNNSVTKQVLLIKTLSGKKQGTPTMNNIAISGDQFKTIPSEVLYLPELEFLSFEGCRKLMSLPPEMKEANTKLKILNLGNCRSLKELPDLSAIKDQLKVYHSGASDEVKAWKRGGLKAYGSAVYKAQPLWDTIPHPPHLQENFLAPNPEQAFSILINGRKDISEF